MSWSEPTRALPLRWGSYTDRYAWGIILIIAGTVSVQGGNANFNLPIGLGTVAVALGWWIMPAAGWRRFWVVLPGLLGTWTLLIGPGAAALLAGPFLCWLLVRHRPWPTIIFVVPVIAVALALHSVFTTMATIIPTLVIMGATMALCAWGARFGAIYLHSLRQRKGVVS